jgi:RNA polymerase sigma-70 factor (ECF subfamily)
MQNDPDKTAFLEQVKTHQGIVHKVAFVYGCTAADREDLVQEILLQLWKSYDSFDGRARFPTWMYRVALNTAITFRRRQRPSLPVKTEPAVAGIQLEQATLSEELRLLHAAIARLGPVDKAIVMQWLDERRYEEIADTMGMTAKNVSVRLVRIRERLAHWIREASTP